MLLTRHRNILVETFRSDQPTIRFDLIDSSIQAAKACIECTWESLVVFMEAQFGIGSCTMLVWQAWLSTRWRQDANGLQDSLVRLCKKSPSSRYSRVLPPPLISSSAYGVLSRGNEIIAGVHFVLIDRLSRMMRTTCARILHCDSSGLPRIEKEKMPLESQFTETRVNGSSIAMFKMESGARATYIAHAHLKPEGGQSSFEAGGIVDRHA